MPPRWLAPWLLPVTIVLGVILGASVGWLGAAVLLLVVIGGAFYARTRYLKQNPPDPELRPKRFGLPF